MKREAPARFAERFPALYRTVANKYYWDEWNDALVVRPIKWSSTNFLWGFFDDVVIDGSVNGVAWLARWFGGLFRRLQSGYVFTYALSILVGGVVILGAVLWVIRP